MKFRVTFVLLFLNLLVFFFLFRQESPFDLRSGAGVGESGILPRPMEEATRITVSGSRLEQEYSLRRNGDSWIVEAPLEWTANPFAIRRIITRLEATEVAVRFPVSDILQRNQTIADYGLAEPSLLVQIEYGGERFDFAMGAPVEIGERLYMLSPDERNIFVVHSNILAPFLIPMEDLRSEVLFPLPVFEVQSLLVEFKDDNSRRRFTRRDNQWVIDTPFVAKGNNEQTTTAVHGLIHQEFYILENSADFADDFSSFEAVARFELVGNRRSATLLVQPYMIGGEINPDLYMGRMEGFETLFLIPASDVDWWRNAQNQLRERRFISFDPGSVTKIEVASGAEAPQVLRLLLLENNNWRMYEGQQTQEVAPFSADRAVVFRTLDEINRLIALEFVSDSPSQADLGDMGLAQPERVITVTDEEEFRLLIGFAAENYSHYVKIQGAPTVYRVSSNALNRIGSRALDYRQRHLRLIDPDSDIVLFEIEDRTTGEIVHNPSLERLVETARQPITLEDAEALELSFRVLFRDLAASEYFDVPADANGSVYLDEPIPWRYDVRLFTGEESSVPDVVLYISERLSGSVQLAFHPERDLLFNLNQDVIDVLFPLLFAREIPPEYEPPPPGIPDLIDPLQTDDNDLNEIDSAPVGGESELPEG